MYVCLEYIRINLKWNCESWHAFRTVSAPQFASLTFRLTFSEGGQPDRPLLDIICFLAISSSQLLLHCPTEDYRKIPIWDLNPGFLLYALPHLNSAELLLSKAKQSSLVFEVATCQAKELSRVCVICVRGSALPCIYVRIHFRWTHPWETGKLGGDVAANLICRRENFVMLQKQLPASLWRRYFMYIKGPQDSKLVLAWGALQMTAQTMIPFDGAHCSWIH